MHGTFCRGDVLLIASVAPEAIRPGDVIAFYIPASNGDVKIMAHRVQGQTAAGFITQGDSNPLPDTAPVSVDNLVGRVCFIQRGNAVRPVLRGRAGHLWVRCLCLYRRIARLGQLPYHVLRASGVVPYLWRPHVVQMHLTTDDGPLVKYTHRRRVVACWWPEDKRFWCRKPYDLVLEHPGENGYRG